MADRSIRITSEYWLDLLRRHESIFRIKMSVNIVG
jgi:hypothetical protein